jgi:hypothetical protein
MMSRTKVVLISASTLVLMFPAVAVPVVPSDPPLSAERIERLPPEIRTAVLSRCGARGSWSLFCDLRQPFERNPARLLSCLLPGRAEDL